MSVIGTCNSGAESLPQTTAWVTNMGNGMGEPIQAALPPGPAPVAKPRLHRLSEVRRREKVTRRTLSRRLGISIREVQQQEQPSSDISLSDLYRWQDVLQVPAAELLSEPEGELSPPVRLRARLLRVMKTARSIENGARQVSIRRLATMLVEQLVDIMPELKDTVGWPGSDRRQSPVVEPSDWHLLYERRWS